MKTSLYVKKIVNEVVGGELSRLDTTTPEYIAFLKGHTDGLSPDEADEFEVSFRNNLQFIHDFRWCFLAIYLDHYNGKLHLPVRDVVKDTIGELVRIHYPAEYTTILSHKGCQVCMANYAAQFYKLLMSPNTFDSEIFTKTNKTPVDDFSYINAHQFVNLISGVQLVRLEKINESVPLQLTNTPDANDDLAATPESGYIPDYLVSLNTAAITRQKSIKTRCGCFITLLLLILLTTYLTSASLNPVTLYYADNLLAKIVVSVLAGILIVIFLQLLTIALKRLVITFALRTSVAVGTGRPTESAICPRCGLSVLRSNDILGLPIVCHTCHVAWHDGPQCYRRGMPPSNDMLPSYPCPNCRAYDIR